jgi:hypothetical protein
VGSEGLEEMTATRPFARALLLLCAAALCVDCAKFAAYDKYFTAAGAGDIACGSGTTRTSIKYTVMQSGECRDLSLVSSMAYTCDLATGVAVRTSYSGTGCVAGSETGTRTDTPGECVDGDRHERGCVAEVPTYAGRTDVGFLEKFADEAACEGGTADPQTVIITWLDRDQCQPYASWTDAGSLTQWDCTAREYRAYKANANTNCVDNAPNVRESFGCGAVALYPGNNYRCPIAAAPTPAAPTPSGVAPTPAAVTPTGAAPTPASASAANSTTAVSSGARTGSGPCALLMLSGAAIVLLLACA